MSPSLDAATAAPLAENEELADGLRRIADLLQAQDAQPFRVRAYRRAADTLAGLEGVSPDVLEAACGIGMTPRQQLLLIELPLSMPVIVAGIRTAAVVSVGIATLSAFIGAGGLGQFINRGLALSNTDLILLGAIPAALLALIVDGSIAAAQWGLHRRRSRDLRLRTGIRPHPEHPDGRTYPWNSRGVRHVPKICDRVRRCG